MTTIVHVTKLAQWRSVLTTWFDQGADWFNPVAVAVEGLDKLMPQYFTEDGARYLHLDDNTISWSVDYIGGYGEAITYKSFYELQKTKPAFWLSRAQDKQGNRLTLLKTLSGMIHTMKYTEENKEAIKKDSAYHLTQPEIEKWGFNPGKFTREPVEDVSIWVSEPDARGKEHVLLKAGAVVTNKEYSADLMRDYTTETIYHLTEAEVKQSIYNPEKFTPVTIEDSETLTQTYKLSGVAEDLIDGGGLFSIKVDTAEQASILKDLLNVSNSYVPSRDRYLLVYGTAKTFTKYQHTKPLLDFDEAVEKV